MPRVRDYERQIDRRTATQFIVACEGERGEEIYLLALTQNLRRVDLLTLPTGADGRSAPRHLLQRLQKWKTDNRALAQDARLWMVFDVDHHFEPNHAPETHAVLSEAKRDGIEVAISNPRFELWLLLHFEDVNDCPGDFCEQRLKEHLGAYNHARYNPTFLAPRLAEAIRRAQTLDVTPDARLPNYPGSQIYRLMLAILTS